MKTAEKLLIWISWIFASMGFLFIILGLVQVLIGLIPGKDGRLFGDTEVINFFIASSSFFIIPITFMLYKLCRAK